MSARYPPVEVLVWGELACFTRPEMKVERVTYPVPTPSGARGILEAIFWKPEFTWEVEEIWVLKPIQYFSILRNEVNSRQSVQSATGWAKNGGGYFAAEDRAQRHTLALKNVAYVIKAQVALRAHANEGEAKYRDQFRRRVETGRCFQQPFFGCREFVASFGPVTGSEQPISVSEELGSMLLGLDYASDGSGHAAPQFFAARLEHGVLRIPTPRPGEANHAAAKAG